MTLPQPFWTCNVWSDDQKNTLVAGPINRLMRVSRDRNLNQHYSYELELILEDKATGTPNPASKGHYVELYIGATMPQTLWLSGYIQSITQDEGEPSNYTLQIDSASFFLHGYRELQQKMKYGPKAGGSIIYQNVMDMINGVANTDGQRGILPFGQWKFTWLDGNATPLGSDTTPSNVTSGNTAVGINAGGYVPTNGANQYNVVSLTDASGTEFYQLTNVNSPTNFSIRPAAIRTYTTPTVKFYGYQFPGTGDSLEVDWDTGWNALLTFASIYGFQIREKAGSTAHSGTLVGGPLNDATSGATIWGGTALATHQGRDSTAYSYQPDVAAAQASGLAVITAASYNEDLAGMYNLHWLLGAGEGKKLVTIRSLTGGEPTGNGWTIWQPYGSNGRTYYVKASSRTSYDGQNFEFVASHDADGWRYGVVDRTNVTAYGIQEYTLELKSINDPSWLLSAGIGHLMMSADPTPKFTFHVQHPLTSASMVPNLPNPGEAITVNYSGQVHDAVDIDTNPVSATYGQWIGVGPYTYLSYPGPWATTTPRQNKIKRCVGIQDEWSSDHGFTATYDLGRGKWHSKTIQNQIAIKMAQQAGEKKKKHHFTTHPFHHIPWLFSQNPDAWEDIPNEALVLEQTGAIVVSDAIDDKFFSDHHYVAFTIALTQSTDEVRFWFAKPTDQTLQNSSASGPYGFFRLCCTGASGASGFYHTTNGAAITKHGYDHKNPHVDINGKLQTGTYRVIIHYHGITGTGKGEYRAQVEYPDAHGVMKSADVSTWRDLAVALPALGAIGFQLVAGTNVNISQVHCSSKQHDHAAPQSIGNRGINGAYHTRKRNRQTSAQYNNGLGGAGGSGRIYVTR